MLDQMTAHDIAHMLRDQFGDNAINVATKKERDARDNGRASEADDWVQVRQILREGRSPVRS